MFYRTLYSAWGRQHWWPAQSRFEMIVGAYLTQNTSWNNVEKAMRSLRRAKVLNLAAMRIVPTPRLEQFIRSAGYFRQKAKRLKEFIRFLDRCYGGSLTRMFAQSPARLREELLALNGVGPETADSILLYAGNHPVFVVDAYTRRIFERHGLISSKTTYEEIRGLCEDSLSVVEAASSEESAMIQLSPHHETGSIDNSNVAETGPLPRLPKGTRHAPSRMSVARRPALVQMFNEMHGLIVGVGKNYCKKSQMQCEACPLQKFLPAQP